MPLLDKILLWFSTCIDGKHETRTISTKDMTSLVITLATLNFSPDQTSHTSVLDYVAKVNISDKKKNSRNVERLPI